MLRPTVSKAFAAPPGQKLCPVDPGALRPGEPRSRVHAVSRLFTSLYETFAEAVRRHERSGTPYGRESEICESSGGESYGDESGHRATFLRLSRERTLLEGIEFVLETSSTSWRFVNNQHGRIEVARVENGRLVPAETLSVQQRDDGFLPIRKRAPGAAGEPAAGFEFTTIRTLAEDFLGDCTDC